MFDSLKTFVAIVDGGSLTEAASRLNLTQSAISRRMQQLEETLGGALLDRSQRPPVPTLLGRRVYEHAGSILRAVDDVLALPQEGAAPSGTLRLGVTPALGDAISADMITRIKAEFPTLDVRLRTEWGAGLMQRVTDGDLDAAVILMPFSNGPAAPLVGTQVAAFDIAVVQSRQHPRVPQSVRLVGLADQDWVLNPVGCGYRSALESAMGQRGRSLRVVVDAYGTDLQLRMVASGLGLGLVPRSLLRASISRDGISLVEVSDFSMRLDVWLVHGPRPGNLKRAIDGLAEGMIDSFARLARTSA